MTRNQLLEMFPMGDPPGLQVTVLMGPDRLRLMKMRGVGDPISLVMGAVGIGTSLFGASEQSSAAQSAANTQVAAAKQAGQVAQTQANLGASNIMAAVPGANQDVADAATNSNALLASTNTANLARNQAAVNAGTTATTELQNLSQAPGFSWNPATDPGYQFRLQEGMKALQNSAAAKGANFGGAAEKATVDYGQNYATQEYQNAFNNFQTNRANQAALYNPIIAAGSTAAGLDAQSSDFSAGTQSGNTMAAGTFAGSNTMAATTTAAQLQQQGANAEANALTQSGNAQAAGTVGSANAWASGLSGASGAATNSALLYSLLSKQSATNQNNTNSNYLAASAGAAANSDNNNTPPQ